MGDPKKRRKKYKTPHILWNKDQIEQGINLFKQYGLKNKKELWKMEAILDLFSLQSKRLIASTSANTELEKEQLLKRVSSLGLISATAKMEDILALSIDKILERRLQTLVFKKGLSRTINQARQFITHEHITVGDKKITSPAYLVSISEENKISFPAASALFSLDHPERLKEEAVVKNKPEAITEKPKQEKQEPKIKKPKEKQTKKKKPAAKSKKSKEKTENKEEIKEISDKK